MDIWSPLYVAHPSASSDISPVPITIPPILFATFIRICVLSRACAFSYVTSCTLISCPISRKWIVTASLILISSNVAPNFFVKFTALLYVRSVVPKQGIVTATIFFLSRPIISNARTVTSKARVESNPPEIPMTTLLHPV